MPSKEEIKKLISQEINVKQSEIKDNHTSKDIAKWDSLAHLRIMLALEKKFDVKINTSKMSELDSIPKILKFFDK
tara:strand:- start:1379 stop:1603 length:225 start_codon:yes stop_codon:yes gene_type:complete